MKKSPPILVLMTLVVLCHCTWDTSFKGFRAYCVSPDTQDQIEIIRMFTDMPGIDFWLAPQIPGMAVDILVDPDRQKSFQRILALNKIKYSITINDLESVLARERMEQRTSKLNLHPNSLLKEGFQRYYTYKEINKYLDHLAKEREDVVHMRVIGKSSEGRDIKAVKISTQWNTSSDNPAIFIEAGSTGREWISVMSALCIINQLVEIHDNYPAIKTVDWYILPVSNPDGYEYSHTNNRMWVKTRSLNHHVSCRGVNINNNFEGSSILPYRGENDGTNNPCSNNYGKEAFSEPETKTIRDFILAKKQKVKLFISLRAYGNMILYPRASTNKKPSNWKDLEDVARKAAERIYNINKTEYLVGRYARVLHRNIGTSIDWALKEGVPFVYTMAVSDGYGYFLPIYKIAPIAEEVLTGLLSMWDTISSSQKNLVD